MTPEQILKQPARVLTQAQREHYFELGYVSVEGFVPDDLLNELQRVTKDFVDQSRAVTKSDNRFDIGPGHTADHPVLRRLKSPDENSEAYWNFSCGLMADVAADLAGPNVVFHHSKLNFKLIVVGDQGAGKTSMILRFVKGIFQGGYKVTLGV